MFNDSSNQNWWDKALVIAVVLGFMVLATVAFAKGPATIRPIEDFVDPQGTFCAPPSCDPTVPPIADFIGFADVAKERLVSVDYADLANMWIEEQEDCVNDDVSFGTEMSGTVIERPLKDGRAEVHVILKTKNALTWVVDGLDDFNDPLLFGNRAPDVCDEGKEPALGESFLEVKFINTAPGAPLPDLIQLAFFPEEGQELLFLALRARAKGELHELFGVTEGTPGRATVVQTGLFMTGFMGAVADGFPVERIDLKVVGR